MLKMKTTYTEQDFQKELREATDAICQKAKNYGLFPDKTEEKKQRAELLEKTTEKYISFLNNIDKGQELIGQLKANGYDLKFSTEMESHFTDDAIIVKVSSENPDELPQDEINNISQELNKFVSYHTIYKSIKEMYGGCSICSGCSTCSVSSVIDSSYFEGAFQYVAVKEYCRNSTAFLTLEEVRKLMLMSGRYMYEIGYKIGKGGRISSRLKKALRKLCKHHSGK